MQYASKIQGMLDLGKHLDGMKNSTLDSNGSIPGLITARSNILDELHADNTFENEDKQGLDATFNPKNQDASDNFLDTTIQEANFEKVINAVGESKPAHKLNSSIVPKNI